MKKEKIGNTELFLFDQDGTLYLGEKLFEFSVSLLDAIKKAGKKYLFVTNNSSKSVCAYVDKLKRLGIDASADEFMTSSQATAFYLRKYHPGKRLYVSGTKSLKDELSENGFMLTESTDDAECIVMGFDRELTYKRLEDISYMLCTREIPYIATNPDYVCPTEFGSVPDCGSMCDMIFNATGKRPVFIGKPSALMIELAMEKAGCTRDKTAVVGDRIYTDVKSGINAGVLSILVMSGETTEEILKNSADKPDIVLQNAGEIIKYL